MKAAIDELRRHGVQDFRHYLEEHPEFVEEGVRMVKLLDVNKQSLKMFGATHKDELLASLDRIFLPETLQVFAEELVAIAEGWQYLESETVVRTLQGQRRNMLFSMAFPTEEAEFKRWSAVVRVQA